MKNILLLTGIALLSLVAAIHATAAPPMIQFRLVVNNPTADSEQMTVVQPDNSPSQPEVLNVQKTVLLDSSDVKNASVTVDNRGNPKIDVKFTVDGTKRFAEATGQNIGRRLAVVIDGKLCMAPQINSAIEGGVAQITGAFSKPEAQNIVARLNGSPAHEVPARNRTIAYVVIGVLLVAIAVSVLAFFVRKGTPPAG